MRKIEKQIIEAINKKRTCTLSRRDYVDNAEGEMHVTLHATRIAVIQDKCVIVNSGGWYTNTTKSRLNAILREYCYRQIRQEAFVWYVRNLASPYETISYTDGMIIPRVR